VERTPFSTDLGRLEREIARMAEAVTMRIEMAVRALVGRQRALAQEVVAGDAEVNECQAGIEQLALKLLALQQPAARDLRLITTAIKVSADLERIGDQAVNLAETALRIIDRGAAERVADLEVMAALSVGMTRDAVGAFLGRDAGRAREVLGRDDEVDYLRDQMFRVQVALMSSDRRAVEQALGLILISRNLERVADHATNIAEDAVFLVEAKDVRHHHVVPP
jgi:phosphate transport system protein